MVKHCLHSHKINILTALYHYRLDWFDNICVVPVPFERKRKTPEDELRRPFPTLTAYFSRLTLTNSSP